MRLSAAQLTQMSRLLDEALDLDEAGRRQWLERLAPEHRELEASLRHALLGQESHGIGSDGLNTLPKVTVTRIGVSTLEPGDRIGPYQLERTLGSGGMAEVWLAQRSDGAFKREVALKIPASGEGRRDLADRFTVERDILAALEHPNIARFYDAGVGRDGRPYLVLEYVPGKNLLKWADEHMLGVRRRIELFLQVLQAVQYAHDNGVLHRDIKPSNVLVKDEGQVRLLDFGVAKLLEHSPQWSVTQVHGRMLTPEYASPEQIKGEEPQRTSDVYSLGVMLYELLCGARPTRAGESASSQDPPSTRIDEPAATVRAATVVRLAHQLRGDIDAITLKALAPEPSQRYQTALAFAHDLQHYLGSRPVKARPDTLAYRLGKFIQRHRIAVPASTVAVALFAALGAYTLAHGPQLPPQPNPPPTTDLAATDKSIAVLPFADLSEKKDLEYLGDGIAEELRNLLVKVPQLKVIGRMSSFQFKGRNDDLRMIGDKLGVAYIVEGSVRKAGSKIRVTAQLSDARSGTQRWAESYDSDIRDVLSLQEEIATRVARTLQLAIGADDMNPVRRLKSPEAYDLYLRGRSAYDRLDRSGLQEAESDYQEALRLDPSFVRAAEGLALTYFEQTDEELVPSSIGWQHAREAAETALSIDANSALAHAVLAISHALNEFNWTAADAEISKALASNPRDPAILDLASRIAAGRGRLHDAVRLIKASASSDPMNPNTYQTQCVWLYFSGDLAGAENAARRAIELSPQGSYARYLLGQVLLARGDQQGALAAMQAEQADGGRDAGLAIVYHALGRKAESDAALARHARGYGDLWPYSVAQPYGFRGDADRAFDWISKAYAKRDPDIRFLRDDPLLVRLRGDPRYKALLVKMNMETGVPENSRQLSSTKP
jgi:serine/threonine protein kinase/Tfp pilus assembly protein PilF